MRFLNIKKSGSWPMLAIGLVLAGLWANMLLKSNKEAAGLTQLKHPMELPNFMAPVMGREIHKKGEKEVEEKTDEMASLSINLPGLFTIFKLGQ